MKKVAYCLLVLLLFSNSSFGFTLVGAKLKGWNTKNLVFHLNSTNCPASVSNLISKSLDLWNSIPNTHLKLELGSASTATVGEAVAGTASESLVIVCDLNFATTYPGSTTTAGIGGAGANSQNFIVVGAIVLNVDASTLGNLSTLPETTAQVIIAHEMGHVLGLGHSTDSSALMYFSTNNKQDFTLNEDDINGMIYLYGRDELASDAPLGGCGLIKSASGGPGISLRQLIILLLILLLPVFVWKRQTS